MTAKDKITALRRTVLFGDLDEEALGELQDLTRERSMAPGEVLFLVGDEAAGLFVVVSGQIRAFRVNAQGREQTIHVERAGAILGEVPLFDDGPYPATALAEEPTRVLFLAKEDFLKFLLRHAAVALTALRLMAKRLRGHAELVDALALQQVGQRLARVLVEQAKATTSSDGNAEWASVTLSNEELAKRVGSVREVVSRTLARFELEGFVSQYRATKGKPRRILITNAAAIENYAACGEPR